MGAEGARAAPAGRLRLALPPVSRAAGQVQDRSVPRAAPPGRVAGGRQLRAHHLRFVVADGDDIADTFGVKARAPRGARHAAGLVDLVRHPVELLHVPQRQGHGVPLHQRKLVAVGNPRHVALGPQLDLLRVEDLDRGELRAVPVDVLRQGRQPLLDGHAHPTGQRVRHDADDPVTLRHSDHVDRLLLQVLHHVAEELIVGERVPEPLGDHVAPINHRLHGLGVPLQPVVDEALQNAADPSRGAQGVVPVEEEYRALVREGAGEASGRPRGRAAGGQFQDDLRLRARAVLLRRGPDRLRLADLRRVALGGGGEAGNVDARDRHG
eukprot:CAMPEP_0204610240 /NCGR_PEP_ID=MMETSP0661-20131031/61403_1 /ASSEMBLY_ACC=CAM_ASM_000606 /TAXON_ID=109239 /ORGANISM="Alexandrium margalefi, Strain AMGDE01CS-322" /LENGTH=323 /DNA_ID=CAMNT_0051622045 /DNA_START=204 /DNA_END=1172 /DNA_ORIENTATION=+